MTTTIGQKIGEFQFDELVTDINPAVVVNGGVIKALASETTLKRGTILARSSGTGGSGKLVVLGTVAGENETLTTDCILCDDTVVGTSDVNACVYFAGCFDPNKVIVADNYTITDADKDALRSRGIFFKAAN